MVWIQDASGLQFVILFNLRLPSFLRYINPAAEHTLQHHACSPFVQASELQQINASQMDRDTSCPGHAVADVHIAIRMRLQ